MDDKHDIKIMLMNEIWSDGDKSKTLIQLQQDGNTINFNCRDERAASQLLSEIEDLIVEYTVNDVDAEG